VSSGDPDTTRRPSGNTATQLTYDEDTSSQEYYKTRTPRAAHFKDAVATRAQLLLRVRSYY